MAKRKKNPKNKFIELAYEEAKENLTSALLWIDKRDATWAVVVVKHALALLEVIRNT